jgi:TPP-dependent pyruvate/acetoin dehydrogenase alpha subunit
MLLILFRNFLVEADLFTEDEIEAIRDAIAKEVKEALAKTLETPWPEVDTYMDHLYSDGC